MAANPSKSHEIQKKRKRMKVLTLCVLLVGALVGYLTTRDDTPIVDYASLDARFSHLYETPTDKYFYLVANPYSGTTQDHESEAAVQECVRVFALHGFKTKLVFTRSGAHATELGRQLVVDDLLQGVVIAGGDGTMSLVINGLNDGGSLSKVTVGIVPSGTGNGMAQNVYGRDENITFVAETIARGHSKKIPISTMSYGDKSTLAIFSYAFGFVADVIELAESWRWMGYSRYDLLAAWNIFFPRQYHSARMEFTLGNGSTRLIEGPVTIFLTSGSGKLGGSDFVFWPDSKDDGLLDMFIVHGPYRRLDLLKVLLATHKGTQGEVRGTQLFPFRKVSVTGCTAVSNVDGEMLPLIPDFTLEVTPDKLTVFAPLNKD